MDCVGGGGEKEASPWLFFTLGRHGVGRGGQAKGERRRKGARNKKKTKRGFREKETLGRGQVKCHDGAPSLGKREKGRD